MKYSSGEGKLEVSVYSFFGPINAFFSAKGPEYENLKYQHGYGRNIVHLTVEYHPKSLYLTLGALIAAVLFGVIMSAVLPGKWNTMLDLNLLTPVKTLYITGR
ncbi:MAG: hypothetical protein IJH81_00775 [Lachnospiraceae bacterium]|nr:hypothetical protein [Lachnospiraceae bacterium]